MTPSNTEPLLLKEEISLTFGNGSGDGKAHCDLESIFLWVYAHDEYQKQQLLDELVGELPEKSPHTPDAQDHFDSADYDHPCCERMQVRNRTIDQVVSVIESKRKELK